LHKLLKKRLSKRGRISKISILWSLMEYPKSTWSRIFFRRPLLLNILSDQLIPFFVFFFGECHTFDIKYSLILTIESNYFCILFYLECHSHGPPFKLRISLHIRFVGPSCKLLRRIPPENQFMGWALQMKVE
jgi:hypothetical protein